MYQKAQSCDIHRYTSCACECGSLSLTKAIWMVISHCITSHVACRPGPMYTFCKMRNEKGGKFMYSKFRVCWHQKHSKTDLNYLGVKYLPVEPFPHQKIAHEWAAFARVCSIRHSLHFFSLANWKWMFSLKKGFGFWGAWCFSWDLSLVRIQWLDQELGFLWCGCRDTP